MTRWFRWLFTDRRTGRIVIGQAPNALMLVVVAATASRFVVPRGTGVPHASIRAVQVGSLLLWALDEMVRGVNPFRRIGGGLVLAAIPFRRMLK